MTTTDAEMVIGKLEAIERRFTNDSMEGSAAASAIRIISTLSKALDQAHRTFAAESDALSTRIKELEGALRPFADEAIFFHGHDRRLVCSSACFTHGDLARARSALEGKK